MSLSRKTTSEPDIASGPMLVAEGGVAYHPSPADDPVAAFMELMEVVEALCPQWPSRPHHIYSAALRL